MTNSRNRPSASCQVFGKYALENERTLATAAGSDNVITQGAAGASAAPAPSMDGLKRRLSTSRGNSGAVQPLRGGGPSSAAIVAHGHGTGGESGSSRSRGRRLGLFRSDRTHVSTRYPVCGARMLQ